MSGERTKHLRTEHALRESERVMRVVLEAALDCFVSIDRAGHIVEFNPAAERTFGYRRDQVLGAQMVDLIVPPQLRQRHCDGFARHLATGKRQLLGKRIEITAIRASGEEFPVEMVIVATGAEEGAAFVAYLRDITERRRVEQELRASEARLSAFMNNAPVGMYVKDRDGRYVMLNPEMEKVFGRPREEVIGSTVRELFPPAEGHVLASYDSELLETGQPTVHEEYLPDLDAYAWSLVIRFPIHDDSGAIGHIGGFDVDISKRKRAEDALQASEHRFRALTEAHPVPVVVARLDDSKIVYASPPIAALMRTSREAFAREHITSYYADPSDRARLIEQITKDGSLKDFEVRLRRADGTIFWAGLTSKLITFEDQPAIISGIADLTERKRAEAEIAQQREALHQSEKMSALGSLLAGVAHELNNPLSVVLLHAHLLEETAREPDARRRAEKIRQAADSCARIVQTFLAMARRHPPERNLIELNDVVRSSLDMTTYGLRASGVEVVLDLDPDLPPLWAAAGQIGQVLLNLIVNAQQALAEAPTPRRLTIATRFDAATKLVRLTLVDNGPGVPRKIRRRIFEPFFTTKPTGLGTGLGLSVCQGIVRSHGGAIAIDDAKGSGAAFTVDLPIAVLGADGVSASHPPIVVVDPLAILVVDDEPEIVALLTEILAAEGHAVDGADDGQVALAYLETRDYDVILSDIRMPQLDGPGLYRKLQSLRPELLERMGFLTGDALGPGASRFLADTGAPCLEKPLTRDRVLAFLARVAAGAKPTRRRARTGQPRKRPSGRSPAQPGSSGTNM